MDAFLPSFTSGLTDPFYLYMMTFFRVFMAVFDGLALLRYEERAALIGGNNKYFDIIITINMGSWSLPSLHFPLCNKTMSFD